MNLKLKSSPPPPQKDGWTLWREVYGTVLGTLPFIIGIMMAWGSMSERVRVMEVNHETFKQAVAREHENMRTINEFRDRKAEQDREQIIKALDRISVQIEVLQARAGMGRQ